MIREYADAVASTVVRPVSAHCRCRFDLDAQGQSADRSPRDGPATATPSCIWRSTVFAPRGLGGSAAAGAVRASLSFPYRLGPVLPG